MHDDTVTAAAQASGYLLISRSLAHMIMGNPQTPDKWHEKATLEAWHDALLLPPEFTVVGYHSSIRDIFGQPCYELEIAGEALPTVPAGTKLEIDLHHGVRIEGFDRTPLLLRIEFRAFDGHSWIEYPSYPVSEEAPLDIQEGDAYTRLAQVAAALNETRPEEGV